MSERVLVAAWRALEPVADRLVVIGGNAHRLFPRHELASGVEFELLGTEDVDIAAPLDLLHPDPTELHDRLEAAGFAMKIRGADVATTIYTSRTYDEAYLQFVTPRHGSATGRDGRPLPARNVGGIQIERLAHLDVLLSRPWRTTVSAGAVDVEVAVTHPIDYLAQKLLIHSARPSMKRAKDLLYVHDTLLMFGERFAELASAARADPVHLSGAESKAARRAFAAYASPDSIVVRDAVAMVRDQRGVVLRHDVLAQQVREQLPRLLPLLAN